MPELKRILFTTCSSAATFMATNKTSIDPLLTCLYSEEDTTLAEIIIWKIVAGVMCICNVVIFVVMIIIFRMLKRWVEVTSLHGERSYACSTMYTFIQTKH